MEQKAYGAVEFGGTKTICAIGYITGELTAQEAFPTTTVEATLSTVYQFFNAHKPISALGIGAFGPLDLNTSSAGYGSIGNTPKLGWANVELKKNTRGSF